MNDLFDYTYPQARGGSYHGDYAAGVKSGNGTFKYTNGDVYSGAWAAGVKSGKRVKYTIVCHCNIMSELQS